jgi:hypothetical protein
MSPIRSCAPSASHALDDVGMMAASTWSAEPSRVQLVDVAVGSDARVALRYARQHDVRSCAGRVWVQPNYMMKNAAPRRTAPPRSPPSGQRLLAGGGTAAIPAQTDDRIILVSRSARRRCDRVPPKYERPVNT